MILHGVIFIYAATFYLKLLNKLAKYSILFLVFELKKKAKLVSKVPLKKFIGNIAIFGILCIIVTIYSPGRPWLGAEKIPRDSFFSQCFSLRYQNQ